jgi:hypothetical protein
MEAGGLRKCWGICKSSNGSGKQKKCMSKGVCKILYNHRNVLPLFCTENKVFFIRILPEIEFQNFHAFLSTESLFTFSAF